MKINAVTMTSPSNRYNNVNFGRREHRSEYNEYRPAPSHKLAVPLAATILAMSPVNAHSADVERDVFNDNIEMYAPEVNQAQKEKLVQTIWLPRDLELNGNSAILLYDTNGDTSNIEKAVLRTFQKGNVTKDTDLQSFQITRDVDKKNNTVDSLFFAIGKTTTTKRLADDKKQIYRNGNMRLISQKAFNYLTELFGDSFPINVSTYDKKPRENNSFIDMFMFGIQ